MTATNENYTNLIDLSKKTALLSSISSLLEWDQETYMPTEADNFRAEQLKTLASLVHNSKTSPAFSSTLSQLIDIKSGKILAPDLTEGQNRSLRRWRRDYIKDTCLPLEFVEQMAGLTSLSLTTWRKAKKENSFNDMQPMLEKMVGMCRKKSRSSWLQRTPL